MDLFTNAEVLGLRLISKEAYLHDSNDTVAVEEAIDLMFTKLQEKRKVSTKNSVLVAQYMRTGEKPYSHLSIYITDYILGLEDNVDRFSVSISLTDCNAWYRKPHFLDFDRYIRLLLAICKNFTPLWLVTYDQGFDEEFYVVQKDLECRPRKNFDLTAPPQFKVDVTILSGNNPEALYSLLEHGVKKGWTYYVPNCNAIEPATCLSIEQAVNYILSQPLNHTTSATLVCLINEMPYELLFRLRFNEYRMLTLKPNFLPVNLRDSVLHLLDLCSDFCIAELTTFDARFNEYVLIQYNYESMK